MCCDTLWLIGDRIRTVAFQAVLACADESCTQAFRSYSTIGNRIQDAHGDSVILSMTSADDAPMTSTSQGRQMQISVTRANYLLELRENGWPQSKVNGRNQIETPDSALINAVSKHASGHGEKMWRALKNGAVRQTGPYALFPVATNPHVIHKGVAVSRLTPIDPRGFQVGWSLTVTVDTTLR